MLESASPVVALRRTATVAAIAYLVATAVVVFVEFGIHEKLFVGGQPALTAHNILANEGLFHLSVALDLLYCVGTFIVVAAYYTMLAPFGRTIALVAALMRFVYGATWMLATIRLPEVLRMIKSPDYLGIVGADRLNVLAQLHLWGRGDDYYIGLPFWAISATLLAYLWLKSGYIPKPFAMIGIVASAWGILCAFAYLAAPGFANVVNLWWFDSPMTLFEIGVAVWLLVKGLRLPAAARAET